MKLPSHSGLGSRKCLAHPPPTPTPSWPSDPGMSMWVAQALLGRKLRGRGSRGSPGHGRTLVCGPGSTLLRWNGFQGVVGWLTENSKVRRVKIDPECTWGGMGSVGLPVMLSEDFDGVAEEGGSNTKPEFSVFPHPPSSLQGV